MLREHLIQVRRSARYYTLGGGREGGRGIVYAFHGYGQLAGRFAKRLSPVAEAGWLVVAPEGLSRFYAKGFGTTEPQVGASWMTREDREREIEDQRGYLDAMHAEVAGALDGDVPMSLLGFSQGVSTMARWLAAGGPTGPPAIVVLWAGRLPVELDGATLRNLLGTSRVVVVAGGSDELAPANEVEKEAHRLREAGVRHEHITFDGGHELHAPTLERIFGTP